MAKVGIKCLTYAKYQSGGEGNAIVYSGGTMLQDYMAKAELKENRSSSVRSRPITRIEPS